MPAYILSHPHSQEFESGLLLLNILWIVGLIYLTILLYRKYK